MKVTENNRKMWEGRLRDLKESLRIDFEHIRILNKEIAEIERELRGAQEA
jgi:hypothetical protein